MQSITRTLGRPILGAAVLAVTAIGGVGCGTTGGQVAYLSPRPMQTGVVPAPYRAPVARAETSQVSLPPQIPKGPLAIVLPPHVSEAPPFDYPQPPDVASRETEQMEDPQPEPIKPAKWHVVKPGEILGRIANTYDVSMAELVKWNNLSNANVIRKGQRIVVTEPPTIGSSSPSRPSRPKVKKAIPSSGTHKVKRNQSWWSIAHSYKGLNSIQLRKINAGKKDLHPGDVIYLTLGGPDTDPRPGPRRNAAPKALPANNRYTVKRGDTLSSIAQRFGVPLKKLRKDNHLKTDLLVPGLVLIISRDAHQVVKPTPDDDKASDEGKLVNLPHYVDRSDTLVKIADMYGSKVSWILKANPKIKSDADLRNVKEIQVPIKDVNLSSR